jgi:hypothetical protein
MTRALDAAVEKLAALPPDEQDRIARWLVEELQSQEQWERRFARSREPFGKLADEALSDLSAGRTTKLNPDKL